MNLILGHGIYKELKKQNEDNREIPDIELWLKFQEGDQVAFEMIYSKNVGRLYSYGMKLVSDSDLVKDVIQDLFEEIWNHKERLGKVKSIKSYLYKALRWKLIRQASKQRKLLHVVDEDIETFEEQKLFSSENTFEEEEHLDDVHRKIRLAIARLSRKQQEIIHLRFSDGLTVKEISKITGVNKNTVYYHLSCAIDLLKELKEDLGYLLFICIHWYQRETLQNMEKAGPLY